ncbi:MAG: hypothetical protein ACYSWZ_08465 [Planctomycetota bacterium]|jgi:hypothetical protein
MSNKCYAVLLVLAGMVCGILLVSLASSPAAAKLPAEGRETTRAVSTTVRPVSVPPVVALPNIRVYPVGMGGKDDQNASAYIVIDGKIWYCKDTMASKVNFR